MARLFAERQRISPCQGHCHAALRRVRKWGLSVNVKQPPPAGPWSAVLAEGAPQDYHDEVEYAGPPYPCSLHVGRQMSHALLRNLHERGLYVCQLEFQSELLPGLGKCLSKTMNLP